MANFKENNKLKQRSTSVLHNVTTKPDDKSHLIVPIKATSSNAKLMGLVFISLLLDLLAFTMILPLFPSLLEYYNKEEGSSNNLYGILLQAVKAFQKFTGAPDAFATVLFGGALGSMYSFLQFLTSPIVGSLSDAYGRKPLLLVCLVGISLSHLLWGYAQSFSIFVLARFIGGLSKANVSLSMAIVTDVSNEKNRAKGMALIGLAFSIGFIVGPLAGAWFSKNMGTTSGLWGERPAFYAFGLSLANIFLVMFCIPETLHKDKRIPLSLTLSKSIDFVSPWHLLNFSAVKNLSEHQKRVLSKLGKIYFLHLFIYAGLEFTVTFLTHHTFGYSAMQQGKMFLVIGLIMALLQGGAARRLSSKGAELAARGSLSLMPLAFLSVAISAHPSPFMMKQEAWLWTGLVLFAIATAFAVSCLTAMSTAVTPESSRGAVLGSLRSLGALARAIGPLLAAPVYWHSGAFLTYAIGSVFLIIPAVMLCRLKS